MGDISLNIKTALPRDTNLKPEYGNKFKLGDIPEVRGKKRTRSN